MRILFTCGREPQYVRNEVILRALRRRYQVVEVTDHRPGSLTARSFRLLPRLVKAISQNDFDLIFVGFYGYLLVPWLRHFSKAPLLFDAFVSNYDTLCFDRQQFQPNSFRGKIAFWLDKWVCQQADTILLDTATHKQYFMETFNLPAEKLDYLYVSCNEDLFQPHSYQRHDHQFRVLSYSSYLPLHGVENIIRVAKLLEAQKEIRFRLIGNGPTYPAIRKLSDQLNINNIDFIPPLPYSQLPQEISQADLCLAGPFGDTPKARRVIPGKLFQCLAMARPTIAGDTVANRELLTHRQGIWLTPLGEVEPLAEAIMQIKDEGTLSHSLAQEGYHCYQTLASEQVIRRKLYRITQDLADGHSTLM